MKIAICLLALLASTSYGDVLTLTGISFSAKYTNMSTKALSTCAVNATVTFASTPIVATDSLELFLIAQQSSTTLTVNDHGMYLACTFAVGAGTCSGSFVDVTTAAPFISGPPITWASGSGIVLTANSSSGSISVTTPTVAATVTSAVFVIASVPYGAFDEGWNSTYRGKATADIAGVYAYYKTTEGPPGGIGILGTGVIPVNDVFTTITRYTTCTFYVYNASTSSTASSIATLGGIAYLAFF